MRVDSKSIYVGLNDEEKTTLIQLFYDMYFNTAQEIEEFSKEFYSVVGTLLSGSVPTSLEHLVEYETEMIDAIPRLESLFDIEE